MVYKSCSLQWCRPELKSISPAVFRDVALNRSDSRGVGLNGSVVVHVYISPAVFRDVDLNGSNSRGVGLNGSVSVVCMYKSLNLQRCRPKWKCWFSMQVMKPAEM